MKKIIRIFTFVLIMCVLGVSCLACGDSGGGGGGGGSKNVLRIGIQDSTSEYALTQSLIAGFKTANPDITQDIRIESYSGNYSDKLITQASNGALPDVFFTLDSLVGFFASKRITLDLSDYFEQYNFTTDLIYEEIAEVGKVGDELHMFGREYSQVVLYYNKSVFDSAGVSYPTDDWSWDDMIAAARNLVRLDTDGTVLRAGIDMRLDWPVTMLQYFKGNSGEIINANGTAGSIDANARAAYEELRTLVKDGVILNTFGNTGLSFNGGNVGMYFGVRGSAPSVNNSLSSWDVVHVPDMDKHVVALGASGYSVSSLSPNKDLALRFIFYIMSEAGQSLIAESGLCVPALKSLAESDVWTSKPKAGINFGAFLQEQNVEKVYPISYYLADASSTNKLTDALNKQVTTPILTSATAISDSQWSAFEGYLTTALR